MGLLLAISHSARAPRVVDDAAAASEEPGRPAAPTEELGATAAISHLGRTRGGSRGTTPTTSPQPDGDRR